MATLLSHIKESFTGLFNFSRPPPTKVVMLGLDKSGKTTVLYKLKILDLITPDPPFGLNFSFSTAVEQPTPRPGFLVVWDVAYGAKIDERQRISFWKEKFKGSKGLLFVLDASDRSRFVEARGELSWILQSDEMAGVPVVVFANKQDLPQAASSSEVAENLGLSKISSRKWHVQETTATLGEGLEEAMEELNKLVKDFKCTTKTT